MTRGVIFYFFFTLYFSSLPLLISCSASPTKLCANDDCTEKLFATTATRSYESNHDNFLKFKENDTIDIYAIKFSHRIDLIEGATVDGQRGILYMSHIDLFPYVFYLHSVVKENKPMSEVTIDRPFKVVAHRDANPFLWRDYQVQAKNVGEVPEEIPIIQEVKKGHAHHHHHHFPGDGHDHGHDHDHEHEHEQVAATPPPTAPAPVEAPPTPAPAPAPTPTPTVDPVVNVAPQAPVVPPTPPVEAPAPPPPPQAPAPQVVDAPPPPPPPKPTIDPVQLSIENMRQSFGEQPQVKPAGIDANSIEDLVDQIAATVSPVVQEEVKVAEVPPVPEPVPPVEHQPPVQEIPYTTTANPVTRESTTEQMYDITTPAPPTVTVTEAPLASVEPVDNIPPPPPAPVLTPEPIPTPVDTILTSTPLPPPERVKIPEPVIHSPPPPVQQEPPPPPQTPEVESKLVEAPPPQPTPAPLPLEQQTPPPKAEDVVTLPPPTVAPVQPPVEHVHEHPEDPKHSHLAATADAGTDVCYSNDCSGTGSAGKATITQQPPEQEQEPLPTPLPLINDFQPIVASQNAGFIAKTLRPAAKSITSQLKSALPYPISDFDDTGIYVLIFVAISSVFFVISLCFSDGAKQDVLDRRMLHDSLTRIKEQDVIIKKLQSEATAAGNIPKLQEEFARREQELISTRERLNAAANIIRTKESELSDISKEAARLQTAIQQLHAQNGGLQSALDKATNDATSLNGELDLLRRQLDEANTRQTESRDELLSARRKIDEYEVQLTDAKHENSTLQVEVTSKSEQVAALKTQIDTLTNEQAAFVLTINNLQDELKAAESKPHESGSSESNGWSDMDLGDLDAARKVEGSTTVDEEKTEVEDEPTPKPKPAEKAPVKVATLGAGRRKKDKETLVKSKSPSETRDQLSSRSPAAADVTPVAGGNSASILETVKLMSKLREVETECDDLKRRLDTEKRNREIAEEYLEQVKRTLEDKKSDLEQVTKDKDSFRSHFEKQCQTLDEANHKIERLQQERERIFELEKQILVLTAEKGESNVRIKELEKALRKAEEQAAKIETRSYHEERILRDKIVKLEEQLSKARVTSSGLGESPLSGNSSDPDVSVGLGLGLSAAMDSGVPALWSDIETHETSFDERYPTYSKEREPEPRRRPAREYEPAPLPSGRRSLGRRTEPGGGPPPARRYRSRSAGRTRHGNGVASPSTLAPAAAASHINRTLPYDGREVHRRSTGRLSRGAVAATAGYYSSDNSNGLLSPPPELVNRSGVLSGVVLHKPTPASHPKKA